MDETAWLWLDRITIVSAFLAAVFSIATWLGTQWLRKAKRQAEARRRAPITIRLKAGDRLFDLPYQPRRDQLSRSELSGLLSFYHGPDRFDPVIMRRVLESGELNRVLADDRPESGVHEVLVVEVDDEFTRRTPGIKTCRIDVVDTSGRTTSVERTLSQEDIQAGLPEGVIFEKVRSLCDAAGIADATTESIISRTMNLAGTDDVARLVDLYVGQQP
jgi:hypothetical protein